jgi:hypothetical protein
MSPTSLFAEGADLMVRSLQVGLDVLADMGGLRDPRTPGFGRSSCDCIVGDPVPARSCGCDIPPPCWYPKAAGEVTSFGCPGATAMLRLRIHNCGPVPRRVRLEGEGAAFDPPELTLGSMERDVAIARVEFPSDVGLERELLLWIRGCHTHYVRWTVVATSRGAGCCHELDVEDCPDYLHHWYDHFYCAHPCAEPRRADVAT